MATTTLQLTILMLFTNSCRAAWESVTLMKGSTLTLSCPLDNANSAEWQNPHGIMFFKHDKGIKDRRFRIEKLSSKWFDISVSDVTFKDGGDYRCTLYGSVVTTKVFRVTVLGPVQLFKIKTGIVKCSAGASNLPPNIFWQIGDAIQIHAKPHYTYKNHSGKHNSEELLRFKALKTDKLCCIVMQPHLNTEPLMNCVKVRATSKRNPPKTTTWSPTEPQGSTDLQSMTTTWPEKDQSTEVTMKAINLIKASPEATTLEATASKTVSMRDIPSAVDQSQGATDSWRGTIPETVVSTGWTPSTSVAHVPVTESPDKNITVYTSHNSTEGNRTKGNLEEMEKRSGEKANGTLLIFLVTCLIVALSVVVLFLAIKLRRAHIHWKRENEDSDPSIESNKSKSSDEERWWMGQKCRGIFNIAFTKYVTEEPTGVSIVTTPDAMPTKVNLPPVEASPSHFSPHYDAPAPVRETEL
ncbi:cytotoxic and regulatory T-cell molecule isoform X2 [Gadus chalcogrammus]|uniref:cytotoxic and regulatory T-cell molecule isoform X2 n=2 Tax=Gadus chalcogrammus TaxID=1042646 RepID=UPI0024C2787D|nr:cytotoxic and regulatory T-cell molecule isoform X2 [Gadus chalcogrammus]